MKTVYLVRHGESEGNVGPKRQGATEPLTSRGVQQAEFVAKRFETIPIEVIIASPQVRATQTAEIINKVLNKPMVFSDLLIERKKPSQFEGKLKKDPETLEIDQLIKENFHNPEWRHSDEENFLDLKKRALDLMKFVEERPEEHILLATHGLFMRMIAAVVLMGEKLTSEEYWNFYIILETENTCISVLQQQGQPEGNTIWKLVTWNDHAHLGEIKQ